MLPRLLFSFASICVFIFTSLLTLGGCAQGKGTRKPFYLLPNDGLAEVSRYKFSRLHYGVPLEGKATLIVVRENLNTGTYQKTNKKTAARAGVKIMLMKSLPSMNWNHRDNFAVYSAANLDPLRLAVTGEEWCGNNFLELMVQGDTIKTYGRPYTDDAGHRTESVRVPAGYYLYEQLPVLVREMVVNTVDTRVSVLVPQTPYLLPEVAKLNLTLKHEGPRRVKTPAGVFETILVTVHAANKSKYFPKPEKYWVEKKRHFIVRAERNEVGTELGKFHVSRGTYELTHHARAPYWGTPMGPATAGAADRRRATHSAYTGLNIRKWFRESKVGKFTPTKAMEFARKRKLPREYKSSARGNNSLSPRFTGKGGWYYDAASGLFKVNYR